MAFWHPFPQDKDLPTALEEARKRGLKPIPARCAQLEMELNKANVQLTNFRNALGNVLWAIRIGPGAARTIKVIEQAQKLHDEFKHEGNSQD